VERDIKLLVIQNGAQLPILSFHPYITANNLRNTISLKSNSTFERVLKMQLPSEVLRITLQNLAHRDLLNCSYTCWTWNQAANVHSCQAMAKIQTQ
jgi:hypothetical protein